MPLIFTAAVPNTPSLVDDCFSFSPNQSQTCRALKELEGELYFMKPDVVILLTTHGNTMPELITTNISHEIRGEWPNEHPVDAEHQRIYPGDVGFAAHIKEVVDTMDRAVPMTITADTTMPPEVMTPLIFLLHHLPQTKVVVMTTAQFSFEHHQQFGHFLRHESLKTNKRVAIIATGHLGTTHAHGSPFSFHEMCLKFLRENEQQKIIHIDPAVYRQSGSDIGEPLAVLLGVIERLTVRPEILSYEEQDTTGQLVLNFILQ